MTIEQKAKAYDEALKRAKILYNDKNEIEYANAESVLEEVFPLLKESEDEKIRKEIINYFTKGKEYLSLCSIGKDDILAWLEKQGKSFNVFTRLKESKDLDDFAKEYSFNIPSDIYNCLPKEKQSVWINEIENAIKAGAQWQKERMGEEACKWLELHDSYAVPTNIKVRDLKEHLSSK